MLSAPSPASADPRLAAEYHRFGQHRAGPRLLDRVVQIFAFDADHLRGGEAAVTA
jgi:hypothetical protein